MKPDFWGDEGRARETMQRLAELQDEVKTLEELGQKIGEAAAMIDLAEAEDEADNLKVELAGEVAEIESRLAKLELALFLGGKYDRGDAIVTVYAGQGGTEAMDWTQMLQRMYTRYMERRGWKFEMV